MFVIIPPIEVNSYLSLTDTPLMVLSTSIVGIVVVFFFLASYSMRVMKLVDDLSGYAAERLDSAHFTSHTELF